MIVSWKMVDREKRSLDFYHDFLKNETTLQHFLQHHHLAIYAQGLKQYYTYLQLLLIA
jgi:hypothetical protein